MPRTDDEAFVTTTIQLRRSSFERLEKALIGKRSRLGRRVTKRAVFQFLLDHALKDRVFREKMLLTLQASGDE